MALRYGLIGGGFITGFHLRALEEVRGIEVQGLYSRTPPHALAQTVRERGLGEGRVFESVAELTKAVDVVALFGPNFARVETLEEVAHAVRGGARLRGLICEKPLARNLPEADRMLELAAEIGAPTAYFENQVHMKALRAAREQLAPAVSAAGAPALVRSSEEHSGPHAAWFWDPMLQGGGVLADMGCHCIAVGWSALHPVDRGVRWLEPVSVRAEVALLKWGRKRYRDELRERFGVDYARTPAEDFASASITYRNPESGGLVKAQLNVSWMYDKQGLRLLMEGLGPGYAFELNTLRSPLEVFVSDTASAGAADAETALEKSTASRGLLAVQPNEADLYGYTDEHLDARDAFLAGRSALLDWEYGREIVRLTMAAYASAERGAEVDLTDPETSASLERYIPKIQRGEGADLLRISD
jgi:predicted dehydrogenase